MRALTCARVAGASPASSACSIEVGACARLGVAVIKRTPSAAGMTRFPGNSIVLALLFAHWPATSARGTGRTHNARVQHEVLSRDSMARMAEFGDTMRNPQFPERGALTGNHVSCRRM